MKHFIFVLLSSAVLLSCSTKEQSDNISEEKTELKKPLNVMLLIGDGMGLSQVSAAFYYQDGKSNFTRFKSAGFINTSSATHKITDSGAGATAFATGNRSYNGSISVNTDSMSMPSITEILSKKKYATGVVSTSQITHATPACFFAHERDRNEQEKIAAQLHASPVDFFAGGGIKYFIHRIMDSNNYFDSLKAAGFEVDTVGFKENMVYDGAKKYGYLLADDAMPGAHEGRGDFLPRATKEAISYLSKSENGFFAMIEGSQIDWAGHDNNTEYMIAEVLDFDKTIGVALDFAEKDGNTLVIVLADHETGGFSLSAGKTNGEKDYNVIAPSFSTGGHSATLIPVFAYGPGAELFAGIYNNTEIYHKILKLVE